MSTPLADERFRLLVEGVQDYGIFMLDPTGHILSWNAGAALIKGYSADEIIGKHFSTFYTTEAIDRGWPEFELKNAAELGRFEDENWRLRKDGSHFWAQVVITAVRDDAGTLLGFSKVTRDLTERRRHEEALRESEERFRLLVDGVRDYAIIMLNSAGFVQTWNAGAQAILGYSAAEIVGRHFSNFYPTDGVESGWPEDELAEAATNGRFEEEGWRVRRDGTRFWASVILTALRSADGKLVGYAKVTRDITDRQRLATLVRSTREMTEFLAMLSHELRNPLAPIRNAVAILELDQNADATAVWSRELIARQVSHMSRLVDDLLDVSRITSGKISLKFEVLDLRTTISQSVEACEPQAAARKHTLTVSVPEDAVMVRGDTARLLQVFTNLLNNAIKYTPDGGSVNLTLHANGQHAFARITDNGIGLRPDQLERVFDLFAQGERSLARSEGGLGIGLTLVRRLLELHGGTVQAYSSGPQLGSTFEVQLPLVDSPMSVRNDQEVKKPDLVFARHRILVVDDNADSLSSMQQLLRLRGHSVRGALDGTSALQLVAEFHPELVLLDIGLPGLSGYDLARLIRANHENDSVVLCATTGYGQNEDRRRSRDAGFNHHLVKPVDFAAIEAVISSLSAQRVQPLPATAL
ncbi:MAG: PAS domain S-box protein [Gemmatimonas sp.]